MIVYDFHVFRASTRPTKAYSPLIVDSDRVLAFPIRFQRFKPVRWRNSQSVEREGCIQHTELAARDRKYVGWEALGTLSAKDR